MNDTLKNIIPHIIALVVMFALSALFFSPYTMKNKVVKQFDNVQARGIQTEIRKHHREHNETILWTNATFGGMPTYQIHLDTPGNLMKYPSIAVLLGQPITAPHTGCFAAMFFMYFLLMVLRVDWRLAIGGAVAVGLSSYNMDLFIAGHSTKLLATAYLSGLFASTILIYRKQWLLGGALFAFIFALQLRAGHLQITYYSGLLIGLYVLINLVFTLLKDRGGILDFLKSTAILVAFALIGFSTNLPKIWSTQEYSSESQRGKSELAAKAGKDGLEKSYGMGYSLGFTEAILPSFAPSYYGGGREHNSVENTELYKTYGTQLANSIQQSNGLTATEAGVEAKKYLANFIYTGNDFTPGVSIYFGIVAWFLFVIGIVLAKGREKWWLVSSFLFMLFLAMGQNFSFNEFLYDYFPMFNKFRAMSMAMGLAQVALIALAFYGAQKLFDGEIAMADKKKALYISGATVGGLLLIMLAGASAGTIFNIKTLDAEGLKILELIIRILIFTLILLSLLKNIVQEKLSENYYKYLLMGLAALGGLVLLWLMSSGAGSFANPAKDQSLARTFGGNPSIINTLIEDRKSLLTSDAFRSLMFLLVAFGLTWAYLTKKIRSVILVLGLSLLTIFDVWSVSKRIASSDKYLDRSVEQSEIAELEVDRQIKAREGDTHYRVLDLSNRQQGAFQDARASYHHKSMGGYFAAKLMLFEELKGKYFSNPTAYRNILGMFNTKYIIAPPQGNPDQLIPFPVEEACGNAWFIKSYEMVSNADAELDGLANLDTKNKALIQNKYSDYMNGFNMNFDSTATISLTNYHPDRMEYTYSAKTEQLAMFSEMFYEPAKGWNVYLNGEKIDPFIKANFAIRAMRLPAGQNQKLEMKFEPNSYYTGNTIALIGSLLTFLVLFGALFLYFKKNGLFNPTIIANDPLPKAEVKQKVQPTKAKLKKTEPTKDKKAKKKKKR